MTRVHILLSWSVGVIFPARIQIPSGLELKEILMFLPLLSFFLLTILPLNSSLPTKPVLWFLFHFLAYVKKEISEIKLRTMQVVFQKNDLFPRISFSNIRKGGI